MYQANVSTHLLHFEASCMEIGWVINP